MKIVLALVLVACVAIQASPESNDGHRHRHHHNHGNIHIESKSTTYTGDADDVSGEDGGAKKHKCLELTWCPINVLNPHKKLPCQKSYLPKGCEKGKTGDDDSDGAPHCKKPGTVTFCPVNAKGKKEKKHCWKAPVCGDKHPTGGSWN